MDEDNRPRCYGVGLEDHPYTRCAHYHTDLDVLGLKAPCCGKYYACKDCHDDVQADPKKLQGWPKGTDCLAEVKPDGHKLQAWPADTPLDTLALLCGVCRREFSLETYLNAQKEKCPFDDCAAPMNPGCKTHWHIYFERGLLERTSASRFLPSLPSSSSPSSVQQPAGAGGANI